MKVLPVLLPVLAALTLTQAAEAQSFRCKNDLASVGDGKAAVLQRCGAPVLKDSFCKPVLAPVNPSPPAGSTTVNVVPCTTVDDWTYNPGYGQFMTTLRFEEGKLVSISYGDRVK
jgi:hypothetical protein